MPRHRTPPDNAGKLSIGALSRATGLSIDTLRTWESRYGFPLAERKPSGHRVYPVSTVGRLRRMAQAVTRGHRAGEVVPASDADLDRLLAVGRPVAVPGPAPVGPPAAPVDDTTLDAFVSAFDADRLTAVLLADSATLGPVAFCERRIAPLVRRIGEGWAAGRFEIRHEHFLSERVGDLLRSLRLPYDARASGPVVVCATLAGERHLLGLQMAALVLAAAGCRVRFLGADVPAGEIVTAARDLDAAAVAVSVSGATAADAAGPALRALRRALPAHVLLVAGGMGAPDVAGVERVAGFAALDAWAARLMPARRPARGGRP
jgi:methylmalonyl-CoA mutase cobalamin-binding subunit